MDLAIILVNHLTVDTPLSYLTSDLCLFVAVTTTNQAIKALDMLRKNRNKFDLVISDVNMPDMDGFKLLELVELEMDLPVISKLKHFCLDIQST